MRLFSRTAVATAFTAASLQALAAERSSIMIDPKIPTLSAAEIKRGHFVREEQGVYYAVSKHYLFACKENLQSQFSVPTEIKIPFIRGKEGEEFAPARVMTANTANAGVFQVLQSMLSHPSTNTRLLLGEADDQFRSAVNYMAAQLSAEIGIPLKVTTQQVIMAPGCGGIGPNQYPAARDGFNASVNEIRKRQAENVTIPSVPERQSALTPVAP